jgi:hypothetical protein
MLHMCNTDSLSRLDEPVTCSALADGKSTWLLTAAQEADPDPDAAAPLDPVLDPATCERVASICRERGGAGSLQSGDSPAVSKRRRIATSRMADSGLAMARHFTGVNRRFQILSCNVMPW